jgi:hypothetical protein
VIKVECDAQFDKWGQGAREGRGKQGGGKCGTSQKEDVRIKVQLEIYKNVGKEISAPQKSGAL